MMFMSFNSTTTHDTSRSVTEFFTGFKWGSCCFISSSVYCFVSSNYPYSLLLDAGFLWYYYWKSAGITRTFKINSKLYYYFIFFNSNTLMIYLYWSPPAITEISVTVTDGLVFVCWSFYYNSFIVTVVVFNQQIIYI